MKTEQKVFNTANTITTIRLFSDDLGRVRISKTVTTRDEDESVCLLAGNYFCGSVDSDAELRGWVLYNRLISVPQLYHVGTHWMDSSNDTSVMNNTPEQLYMAYRFFERNLKVQNCSWDIQDTATGNVSTLIANSRGELTILTQDMLVK